MRNFLATHACLFRDNTHDRCLEDLKEYQRQDFFGDRGVENYNRLPGKTSLPERAAELGEEIAPGWVTEWVMEKFSPSIRYYWSRKFGSDVRKPVTDTLLEALRSDDDVLVVAHSLGSLAVYDALWKLSHYSE